MCVTDEAESHLARICMWLPCPESEGSGSRLMLPWKPVIFRHDETTKWFIFLLNPVALGRAAIYKILSLMENLLRFHKLFELALYRYFQQWEYAYYICITARYR
jgi:hypothetical protein